MLNRSEQVRPKLEHDNYGIYFVFLNGENRINANKLFDFIQGGVLIIDELGQVDEVLR